MDISIIIPLYNEEESIPELIAWIDRVTKKNNFSWEAVMVDDGSSDRSWEVVKELREQYSQVRGISFRRNYGKSAALHVGFQAAEGDVVITMDADLQDSPDEIPELYRMITEDGFDLVSGWKKKRYDPITKTIPTKLYNWANRVITGVKLHDQNCGLKAYKNKVVKSIEVYGEMHRFIPVIAKAAGFSNIGEKVVQHQERKYGVTKFGLNRFVNGFLDLLSITFISKYNKRPMHFFGVWGMLFSLIGGGVLFYFFVLKLLDTFNAIEPVSLGNHLPGFLFAVVTFLLGVLLLSTGLLAELIGRNSPLRNDYLIEERIGDEKEQEKEAELN